MSRILNTAFGTTGALGSPFSTINGYNGLTVPSAGTCEGTVVSTNNGVADTTNTYANNQWIQGALGTFSNSGILELFVRVGTPTVSTWSGARAGITAGSTSASLRFVTSGSLGASVYTFVLNTSPTTNDVYYFQVTGQTYALFQNGAACGSYTDGSSTLTSGSIGFGFFPPSAGAGDSILTSIQAGNSLAGPGFIQATSASNNTTATTLTTPAITVTAGNQVVVWGNISTSGNPFGSFSSSQGDTFGTIVSFATQGTQTCNAAIIASAVGGSTTFTINTSGVNSNYLYIGVAEFNGLSGTFEQTANSYITSFITSHSSPTTAGALTTGDSVIALVCDSNAPSSAIETFIATSPWNIAPGSAQVATTGTNNYPTSMIMYQDAVANASYTANYTTSHSVQSANVIFGLKVPGGSGSTWGMLLGVGT